MSLWPLSPNNTAAGRFRKHVIIDGPSAWEPQALFSSRTPLAVFGLPGAGGQLVLHTSSLRGTEPPGCCCVAARWVYEQLVRTHPRGQVCPR